jgi:MFS family permease
LHLVPEIDTANPPAGTTQSYTSTIQGITVGAYTLGCFFGAVATIWLGNMLGRKRTIFVGSSIMVVGAILQSSSYGLPQLIVGRWITGFGNGMNTSTCGCCVTDIGTKTDSMIEYQLGKPKPVNPIAEVKWL